MSSYANFERTNKKNANVADQTIKPQATNNEVNNKVGNALFIEQFKKWITFFKLNLDIFAMWYLKIDLYLYQKIMLHFMGSCNLGVFIASRGIKSEVPSSSNIRLKTM